MADDKTFFAKFKFDLSEAISDKEIGTITKKFNEILKSMSDSSKSMPKEMTNLLNVTLREIVNSAGKSGKAIDESWSKVIQKAKELNVDVDELYANLEKIPQAIKELDGKGSAVGSGVSKSLTEASKTASEMGKSVSEVGKTIEVVNTAMKEMETNVTTVDSSIKKTSQTITDLFSETKVHAQIIERLKESRKELDKTTAEKDTNNPFREMEVSMATTTTLLARIGGSLKGVHGITEEEVKSLREAAVEVKKIYGAAGDEGKSAWREGVDIANKILPKPETMEEFKKIRETYADFDMSKATEQIQTFIDSLDSSFGYTRSNGIKEQKSLISDVMESEMQYLSIIRERIEAEHEAGKLSDKGYNKFVEQYNKSAVASGIEEYTKNLMSAVAAEAKVAEQAKETQKSISDLNDAVKSFATKNWDSMTSDQKIESIVAQMRRAIEMFENPDTKNNYFSQAKNKIMEAKSALEYFAAEAKIALNDEEYENSAIKVALEEAESAVEKIKQFDARNWLEEYAQAYHNALDPNSDQSGWDKIDMIENRILNNNGFKDNELKGKLHEIQVLMDAIDHHDYSKFAEQFKGVSKEVRNLINGLQETDGIGFGDNIVLQIERGNEELLKAKNYYNDVVQAREALLKATEKGDTNAIGKASDDLERAKTAFQSYIDSLKDTAFIDDTKESIVQLYSDIESSASRFSEKIEEAKSKMSLKTDYANSDEGKAILDKISTYEKYVTELGDLYAKQMEFIGNKDKTSADANSKSIDELRDKIASIRKELNNVNFDKFNSSVKEHVNEIDNVKNGYRSMQQEVTKAYAKMSKEIDKENEAMRSKESAELTRDTVEALKGLKKEYIEIAEKAKEAKKASDSTFDGKTLDEWMAKLNEIMEAFKTMKTDTYDALQKTGFSRGMSDLNIKYRKLLGDMNTATKGLIDTTDTVAKNVESKLQNIAVSAEGLSERYQKALMRLSNSYQVNGKTTSTLAQLFPADAQVYLEQINTLVVKLETAKKRLLELQSSGADNKQTKQLTSNIEEMGKELSGLEEKLKRQKSIYDSLSEDMQSVANKKNAYTDTYDTAKTILDRYNGIQTAISNVVGIVVSGNEKQAESGEKVVDVIERQRLAYKALVEAQNALIANAKANSGKASEELVSSYMNAASELEAVNNLVKAQKLSSDAATQYKSIVANNNKEIQKILQHTQSSYEDVSTSSKKVATSTEQSTESQSRAIGKINTQVSELKTLFESLKETITNVSKSFNTGMNADSVNTLVQSISALSEKMNSLSTNQVTMSPIIDKEALDGLKNSVSESVQAFSQLKEVISSINANLTSEFKNLVESIDSQFTKLVSDITSKLGSIPESIQNISSVGTEVIKSIETDTHASSEKFKETISSTVAEVDFAKFAKIAESINTAFNSTIVSISKTGDAISEVSKRIEDSLTRISDTTETTVGKISSSISSSFTDDMMRSFTQSIQQMTVDIPNAISSVKLTPNIQSTISEDSLKSINAAISKVIENLLLIPKAINSSFSSVNNTIKSVSKSIITSIRETSDTAIQSIRNIASEGVRVKDGIEHVFSKKDISAELIESLNNAMDSFKKIKSLYDGLFVTHDPELHTIYDASSISEINKEYSDAKHTIDAIMEKADTLMKAGNIEIKTYESVEKAYEEYLATVNSKDAVSIRRAQVAEIIRLTEDERKSLQELAGAMQTATSTYRKDGRDSHTNIVDNLTHNVSKLKDLYRDLHTASDQGNGETFSYLTNRISEVRNRISEIVIAVDEMKKHFNELKGTDKWTDSVSTSYELFMKQLPEFNDQYEKYMNMIYLEQDRLSKEELASIQRNNNEKLEAQRAYFNQLKAMIQEYQLAFKMVEQAPDRTSQKGYWEGILQNAESSISSLYSVIAKDFNDDVLNSPSIFNKATDEYQKFMTLVKSNNMQQYVDSFIQRYTDGISTLKKMYEELNDAITKGASKEYINEINQRIEAQKGVIRSIKEEQDNHRYTAKQLEELKNKYQEYQNLVKRTEGTFASTAADEQIRNFKNELQKLADMYQRMADAKRAGGAEADTSATEVEISKQQKVIEKLLAQKDAIDGNTAQLKEMAKQGQAYADVMTNGENQITQAIQEHQNAQLALDRDKVALGEQFDSAIIKHYVEQLKELKSTIDSLYAEKANIKKNDPFADTSTIDAQIEKTKEMYNTIVDNATRMLGTKLPNEVSKAMDSVTATIGKGIQKVSGVELTNYIRQIDEVTAKLKEMYSERNRKQIIGEDTSAIDAQIAKQEELGASMAATAEAFKGDVPASQYQKVEEAVRSFTDAVRDSESANGDIDRYIKGLSGTYGQLNDAIRAYNNSRKLGDNDSANYWKGRVDSIHQSIDAMGALLKSDKLDEDQKDKIRQIILQCDEAYQRFVNSQQNGLGIVGQIGNMWNKVYSKIRMMTGLSFHKIFRDALTYVKEFDKAIADIAIITGQSVASARELGATYRKLASDLGVTSTTIATAAATIYRQGITDPDEVNAIVAGATKFGAVTGQSTDEAIKVMTAAMQNFRKEGEKTSEVVTRIGDTWSYMGDSVATTGADIALAMSKASASVHSVGLEFEKASSWAAIMLARTQQSGQVIGTQLNSLISRYAKVTSKGYRSITQDDDGEALSFNDVSKALQAAGIQVYDSATKTFLPMGEMMDQLAKKWNTLDEATKKYIATTLGGTRGYNYMLTLMENYDAALSLEAGVIDGIVDSKYDIWLDSVTAAQNNLKNSAEELYSIIGSDMLTGMYNTFAGIVDVITKATDAIGGWNLKTLAAIAGAAVLVAGIAKIVVSFKAAFAAIGALKTAMVAHNGLVAAFTSASEAIKLAGVSVGTAVTGIMGAVGIALTVVGLLVSLIKQANEANSLEKRLERVHAKVDEANENIESLKSEANGLDAAYKRLEKLGAVTDYTKNSTAEFAEIRKQIVANSPDLQAAYGKEGEYIQSIGQAADIAKGKVEMLNRELYNAMKMNIGNNLEAYSTEMEKYQLSQNRFEGKDARSMIFTDLGFSLKNYSLPKSGSRFDLPDYSEVTSEDIQGTYVAAEEYANIIDYVISKSEQLDQFTYKELKVFQSVLHEGIQGLEAWKKEHPDEDASLEEQYYGEMERQVTARIETIESQMHQIAVDYLLPAIISGLNIDYEDYINMFGTEGSPIYNMLLDLMNNATPDNISEIQEIANNLVEEYMKIFNNAITDENIASFEEAISSIEGKGYNIDYAKAYVASLKEEYETALNIVDTELQKFDSSSMDSKYEEILSRFKEAIESGLPESVLKSFNEAVESIRNNPEIENENEAIYNLMESIITSEDYSQIEWPVSVTPDLTIDADAETVYGALNTQLNKILSKYSYTDESGKIITLELGDIKADGQIPEEYLPEGYDSEEVARDAKNIAIIREAMQQIGTMQTGYKNLLAQYGLSYDDTSKAVENMEKILELHDKLAASKNLTSAEEKSLTEFGISGLTSQEDRLKALEILYDAYHQIYGGFLEDTGFNLPKNAKNGTSTMTYPEQVESILNGTDEVDTALKHIKEGTRLTTTEMEALIKKYPSLKQGLIDYATYWDKEMYPEARDAIEGTLNELSKLEEAQKNLTKISNIDSALADIRNGNGYSADTLILFPELKDMMDTSDAVEYLQNKRQEVYDAVIAAGVDAPEMDNPLKDFTAELSDTSQLDTWINKINSGTALTKDELTSIESAYDDLGDEVTAYYKALINGEDATEELEAIKNALYQKRGESIFYQAMKDAQSYVDMMQKIARKEYTSEDINNWQKEYGFLAGQTPDEMFKTLQGRLYGINLLWGDTAKSLGLVIPKYESLSTVIKNANGSLTEAQKIYNEYYRTGKLSEGWMTTLLSTYGDAEGAIANYAKVVDDVNSTEEQRADALQAVFDWLDRVIKLEKSRSKIEDISTLDTTIREMEGARGNIHASQIETYKQQFKDSPWYSDIQGITDATELIEKFRDIRSKLQGELDSDNYHVDRLESFGEELERTGDRAENLKKIMHDVTDDNGNMVRSFTEDELRTIAELGDAYREAVASVVNGEEGAEDKLFGMLKEYINSQDFYDFVENFNTIQELLERLESGDYTALESLIGYFPEIAEYINNNDIAGAIEVINQGLDDMVKNNSALYDFAKAIGLITEKAEAAGEALSENLFTGSSEAAKALVQLHKNQRLSASELETLRQKYPQLTKVIVDYANGVADATELETELNKVLREDYISSAASSISSALANLSSATKGTKEYYDAIQSLANVFNFGMYGGVDGTQFVVDNMADIQAAANGSTEAFRRLQEAAWVNVVGSADVDFSAFTDGIALVGEQAEIVGTMLAQMGLGHIEERELEQEMPIITYGPDGTWSVETKKITGVARVWVPDSSNPFSNRTISGKKTNNSSGKKKSGSGSGSGNKNRGGGGGSSDTVKVAEEIESLLKNMKATIDSFNSTVSLLGLKKEFHNIRGELVGVIEYTKLSTEVLEEENVKLKEYINTLKNRLEKEEAIMKANSKSSKTYKQAELNANALRERMNEYTNSVQQNTNTIEQNKKALRDLQSQQRQTILSVESLIRDTLKGIKELEDSMLSGRVSMEDTVFNAIKARYERERDLAIETAEAKKEALQTEMDAIDKLISARKKLLEQEEKENKILELQKKIARISADPTRRKEMLDMQTELNDLLKEQSIQKYEDDLQAQKDSLQEQSDNLDDYIEELRDYYEDLFKHPQKLLEETEQVMAMTDAEILEWLKTNTEEWETYTEAKQKQTSDGWQDTLNQMRGYTETYQDEIDEIMSWTNEEIIKWLTENNVEFKNSSKAQQEEFISTWTQTLENWRNAFKKVVADINASRVTVAAELGTWTSGGGGGGSSYGGGGSSYTGGGYSGYNTTPVQQQQPTSYTKATSYKYRLPTGKDVTVTRKWTSTNLQEALNTSNVQAKAAAIKEAQIAWSNYYNNNYKKNPAVANNWQYYSNVISQIGKGNSAYVWLYKQYKKGGMADFTGPAWLDGTKQKPERILSAYQTELFEDMLDTLHMIKTIKVSGLPNYNTSEITNNNDNGLTIERIEVNVSKLDTDTDFDELANNIGEAINRKLQRTMAIGGIII